MIDTYIFASSFGNIRIESMQSQLTSLLFTEEVVSERNANFFELNCQAQILQYLAGDSTIFDLDCHISCSSFQQKVFEVVMRIPYGKTMTYKELALKCGGANHARAVANVNSSNKLLLLVPCHRVIGTNGDLAGYAGGVERKKKLLELEGALSQLDLFA